MRFIKRTIMFVALAGIALIAGSYFLPKEANVTRVATISAPPEVVFARLNSLQEFSKWSPWSGVDPDMKVTFSGPPEGVGNTMSWESEHPTVGSGTQTIVASVKNESVRTELDFGDMGQAKAAFLITGTADGTAVAWEFSSDLSGNPLRRYMGLMMDGWIGQDYEKGLAALKAQVEAGI